MLRKVAKTKKILRKYVKFECLDAIQGKHNLYCFITNADTLWGLVRINRRDPDKDEGYQRALSPSRLISIKNYIDRNNPIPNSILISFGNDTIVSKGGQSIKVPKRPDAGWVIDGQHRLAGAHESNSKIELIVVAFIGLSNEQQINQFVTINKEAKGVPSSLYYDLLPKLPRKFTDAELAKERAADIAKGLRNDEESKFFGKIVIVTSPKRGEISLTNFVRKISPLVSRKTGKFNLYSVIEQQKIIDNYYKGLNSIFPKFFEENEPIFFQTVGFGAALNALPTIFDITMKRHNAFKVADIAKVLREIEDFNFEDWKSIGTGSAAEIQAGNDLSSYLRMRFSDRDDEGIIEL